ncbi:hypothetical protein ACHAPJ_006458 [Fusarium lateritium]
MQTKYLSILAAVAATTVSAEVEHVDVVHIFDTLHVGKHIPSFTPNKRDVNAIFARADKDMNECQSSARSILLAAPTPSNRAVQSYFLTAETTDACTLTAPGSLSSDVMSYLTEVNEWASKSEKDMEKLLEDCLDEDEAKSASQMAASTACPTPGTIFFTASNGTRTVLLETALETFATPAPTSGSGSDDADTKDENAAAPRGASMVAAIAAVGVAGFMIAA